MDKKTQDIVSALSHGPVQQYIFSHENTDLAGLVLRHKAILGIPTAQLIEQIATRKKAKEKLPLYYNTPGIVFPPPLNFEQTSSEATARYKSEMIAQLVGSDTGCGADLTGGFGVDTFFSSKKFKTIHYVEPDVSLLEIARHNHHLLGADNIQYHATTAEHFLATAPPSLDFIYADPSRRIEGKKRVHALRDAQPDILALETPIFARTGLLLLKASPLLDIQAGMDQLSFVKRVVIISVNNECKELLFISEKDFAGIATIEAVNIYDKAIESLEFSFPEERGQVITFSDPLTYLYEPNASILKAGAFKTITTRFDVQKISANTHLYTSDQLIDDFPGRKFLIEASVKPDISALKKFFPDGKANVTTRNYPLAAEALRKKLRLRDGGENFLIGFSGETKKFLVVARRL